MWEYRFWKPVNFRKHQSTGFGRTGLDTLSRTTHMPLSAGSKLGPYEILAPMGAGGIGEVYRARDSKLNRDVAIKVLPAALANDAQYMARFEREAQLLAALSQS